MDSYSSFAAVYDRFMDNVPYAAWAAYITETLSEYGIKDGIVAELGCGTGTMTRLLKAAGYDMIGIDASEEMLGIAGMWEADEDADEDADTDAEEVTDATDETDEGGTPQILYLQQDMRSFELYGTVAAVVSVCDCLNYIMEETELLRVFSLVNNYLDPGGIFLFDMNTPYKYEILLGDRVFAENREDCSFIWENEYDKETACNEYDLTIYSETENGLYERAEETHLQKAYEKERIISLLKQAGLAPIAVYDAYTKDAPRAESERWTFVAKEIMKEECK